jgi:predicted N-formylglutamate amidohydrolase
VAAALKAAGYDARLNEPWSGREGFMFAAETHARDHHAAALMLEVRQDLLQAPAWRAAFLPHLLAALHAIGYA